MLSDNKRVIYKYTLTGADSVRMPKGATLLSVGFQSSDLQLWALVDIAAEIVPRRIAIILTGQPITIESLETYKYVGTVQTPEQLCVFHIFDGGEQDETK